MIVRKARIDDLKSVQELNYRLFDFERNNFDPLLNMEWTFSEKGEEFFKRLIERGIVWVAVDGDRLIGYLAGDIIDEPFCTTKAFAKLKNIYVDKDYRRRGIGKELLKEFKAYCTERNIEEIRVTTNSKNTNAREFYESNGVGDFEITYKMKI